MQPAASAIRAKPIQKHINPTRPREISTLSLAMLKRLSMMVEKITVLPKQNCTAAEKNAMSNSVGQRMFNMIYVFSF